jgi:hypothetical protein
LIRLLPFLLLLAAGSPGPPRTFDFPAAGRIGAVAFEDLDGDGRMEVLIWRGKRLSVHRPDERGDYDPGEAQVLDVSRDALFFGTGQVDEDGKTREVVLLTPDGIVCHSMRDGRLSREARTILEAKNLVSVEQEDAVHPSGFLEDLDGDGLPDIVLPTTEGFRVHYQRSRQEGSRAVPGCWEPEPDALLPYALDARIEIGPRGLTGRIRARVGVPDLVKADFTGDGRPDLAIEDGRRLRIFPAGDDGRVTGDVGTTLDLAPLAGENGRVPALRFADLNSDGAPDVLAPRADRTGLDLHRGGLPLGEAVTGLEAKGWLLPYRIVDLDGDGDLDLVVPTTPKFGLPTALSVTFSHAIDVNVSVFLNTGDEERPFRTTPDAVRGIRVKIRLYMDDTGRVRADHSVLMVVEADLDEDGRKDLLLREGTEELLLFPGVPEEGIFSDEESLSVEIPDTEDCSALESVVRDLNGDGRPDVAIVYRTDDGRGDRLVLLVSEREE